VFLQLCLKRLCFEASAAACLQGAAVPARDESRAVGQHSSQQPRQQQQAVANSRKRTAEGLHAELANLEAVAHWDSKKLANLDAFFQRMGASTTNHGQQAAKRQKTEFSAGIRHPQYSYGHNKPRPAAGAGNRPAAVRSPSPMPG
jgi:hypothetical protein